jgi:predicted dehydrogenase
MKILLIGAGGIAQEYIKVLHLLGITEIDVLSQRKITAEEFQKKWGLSRAYGGGQETLVKIASEYDAAIVASPIETLLPYIRNLLQLGISKILVEKPVVLNAGALDNFLIEFNNAPVMVALNRLFFPSVQELQKRLTIEKVRSAEFSFTEWVHRINLSQYQPEVLARWGAANCIHVTSTVFDLIGMPQVLTAHRNGVGDIKWHPNASIFVGSGVSVMGIPFSYGSDWGSAGRWSITVRTELGSYHLEPMESLSFTSKGSLSRDIVVPNWSGETKCGFLEMIQCWVESTVIDPRYSLKQLRDHLAVLDGILYGE